MSEKFDSIILKYADFIIRWRFVVIALCLISAIGAGYGMGNLGFSTNYRVFFSKANPELQAFEAFQNIYTKTDNILFVLQADNKEVFQENIAQLSKDITYRAWREIPYMTRVDSITNFQHSYAEYDAEFDEDLLIVEDLIAEPSELSPADYTIKRDIAVKEPILYGNMLAEDGEAVGVNVTLQFPDESISEVPEAVAAARKIAEEMRAQYPDIKIALTGVAMMNNAFAESGQQDASTLTSIMYLVLIVLMLALLRSFSATISIIFVIGFSFALAMGMAGHIGIMLTPISVTAPTVILTLAIADSIHILVSMFASMRAGMSKIDALKDSVRINFMPVFITSLTTIVGFLTLNFSDAPPFHDLGNITAMGIAAAWFYSVTFLPAFLSLMPIRPHKIMPGAGIAKILSGFSERVVKHRKAFLAVPSLIAVGLIAMIPTIELNDQWVEYFDESIEFRRDADFGMAELTGVYMIEFSVEAEGPSGIHDPLYLQKLDEFVSWMRQDPKVKHVYSYADIMKRLNKNMHNDNEDYYRIPENRELAAQYHLLYSNSLPLGLDLNDRVNIDKSATRITASLGDYTTTEIEEFTQAATRWLQQNTPNYMHAEPTGATIMFSHISERNINSMLRGNVIAIIVISLILVAALRSFGLGLLSIIPNAVPIAMTFGLWAVIFGNVGMAAAGVSAVALGIVVDDTVHFLSKYLRARREKGLDQAEAIKYAFETVGVALVVTTIILTLGFLVMAASSFQVNEQLGLMTATTIVIALIIDFTLLPAILLIGHNKTKEKGVSQ